MIRLIRYKHLFLASTVLCLAASMALLVLQPPAWKPYAAAAFTSTLIAACFVTRTEKSVKAARLIIENQILHIKSAVFYELDTRFEKHSHQPFKSIEVYIACFGILLNSRIIKFNQENIDLRAVELGPNYIALTYGTELITYNAIILHAEINNDGHAEIIQRFRYETGITPTIIQ